MCILTADSYGLTTELNTYDRIMKQHNVANEENVNFDIDWVNKDGMGAAGVAIAIETETEPNKELILEETLQEEVLIGKYGFTEGEFTYFCKCVQSEAGGESVECRRAVAEALLNRLENERFPNNIVEVINAPGQFEVVELGTIHTVVVDEETKNVCMQAVTEERLHPVNMFYFRSGKYHNYNSMDKYKAIGKMYFSVYRGA